MTTTMKKTGWWVLTTEQILRGESGSRYYFSNYRPASDYLENSLRKVALLVLVKWAGDGNRFDDEEWLTHELLRASEYLCGPNFFPPAAQWLDMLFLANENIVGVVEDRKRVIYSFARIIQRERTELRYKGKVLA